MTLPELMQISFYELGVSKYGTSRDVWHVSARGIAHLLHRSEALSPTSPARSDPPSSN